ncbi:MAG TPA: tetratricopeptide repeat-containing glycosyltransferase family protein [Terracidiphilus sp.]
MQDMVQAALGHHRQRRFTEAEQLYRSILAIDPRHPDALHLLGMVAFQTGRSEEAAALIRTAIDLKGNAPAYHSNLGNVLESQGKIAEAGACYQRALLLNPDSAEIYVNLGNIFRAQGQLNSSLDCYRRAMALSPGMADAAAAESAVLLLKGDFVAGWPGSEHRWLTSDHTTPPRDYPWPRWTGGPLASGRLLIWGEQGIGDEIMFAGLTSDLVRSGIRCILDCDPRLRPLFARSFPALDVVTGFAPATHPESNVAAHLPSGSLPGLFRASSAAFAATTSPYLKADPVQQARFRARYADGRKLVGVAWHTSNRKTGRLRSMDLSLFASLFAVPGIRWISLQYGGADALEKDAAAAQAPILIDREVDQLSSQPSSIDRFAAQVAAMDLVITIDNSIAHLAGALAVPTWVLLPFAPDWRWQLDREDSPWYPSLHLFRQPRMGDWPSVVARVEDALRAL